MSELDRELFKLLREHKFNHILQLMGTVSGTERTFLKDNSGKKLLCAGTSVPADGTAGYSKGCIWLKTNAADHTTGFYHNAGTTADCNFVTGTALPTGITLAVNKIIVGQAGGAGLAVDMSSDATIAATGALTIANGAVSLAKMANLAAESVIVNPTAGAAVPQAVAVAEARVLGRATGGHVDDIQITDEHVAADAAIALSKLATQAANTICANATGGAAVPTATKVVNALVDDAAAIAISKIATTGALTPVMDQVFVPTVEATDGDISLLVADLVKGIMVKTNCSAPRAATFDTAANIQGAAWFGATVGMHFDFIFHNASGQTVTLTTAAGLTLRGTAAVPTAKNARVTFVNTGAGAVDVIITLSA